MMCVPLAQFPLGLSLYSFAADHNGQLCVFLYRTLTVFSISGDGLKEIACWDLDVDSRSCQIFASQNARVFAYRNKTARAYALAVFVTLIVLFAR